MVLLSEIILIVLPVFVVIGVGYVLRKAGLVGKEFLFQLNRLIYYVALPALLFYKIATADFSASFNPRLLAGMIISVVAVFGASFLFARLMGYPEKSQGAFCQASFRGNIVYFGLAIVYNGYGESGLAIAGILVGFLVPLYNFLAVVGLLLPQQNGEHKLGRSFWAYQLALNPLIIASFIGILWSFFNIPVPIVLSRSLDILTGMSLPLALIAIGASLSRDKLKGEMIKTSLATVTRLFLAPLITVLTLLLLGISGLELAVGVILAGAPTATASYIMAQQLKSDAELSGAIIVMTTLISVFSYSVILFLLRFYGV
ncbi:MAG: AEC family transporter [Desulfobulbaceae bacterium]|nr:MAG: AEC family transporter [Desulfobulbaceae bacterium]